MSRGLVLPGHRTPGRKGVARKYSLGLALDMLCRAKVKLAAGYKFRWTSVDSVCGAVRIIMGQVHYYSTSELTARPEQDVLCSVRGVRVPELAPSPLIGCHAASMDSRRLSAAGPRAVVADETCDTNKNGVG